MSHLIHKNLRERPVRAVDGEGVWLIDADGNRYLDACGGVAVSSLGHRHPRIRAALEREAGRLSWAHAGTFTTPAAEELATFLTRAAPGMARAQFLSSGSEAVELAMKIAYQYHCERGQPGRTVFLARRQSYHGSTLGALALSANPQRRTIFEPLLPYSPFVSPCYAFRDRLPGEHDAAYADRLAAELDARITAFGPERVAAFTAETVVGSTSGAVPPVPGYFSAVREVCDRYGVLLILDEVMAGMGRTGRMFAYEDDDVLPDIVAIGKGLAAGYQPISAVLTGAHVHEALASGSGVLRNGQTHVNHPLACAIALEVQRTIVEDGLLAAVPERGRHLRDALSARLGDCPFVGDIRGRGLFVGVELVRDRDTMAPMDGGAGLVAALKREALGRGLLIYPGSGTVDGVSGNHVLFAPPFVATPAEVEEMAGRFAEVTAACLGAFSRRT